MRVPSRACDQFQLRLPSGMRGRLAELAKTNLRSMNSEIVFHLERAVQSESAPEVGRFRQEADAIPPRR